MSKLHGKIDSEKQKASRDQESSTLSEVHPVADHSPYKGASMDDVDTDDHCDYVSEKVDLLSAPHRNDGGAADESSQLDIVFSPVDTTKVPPKRVNTVTMTSSKQKTTTRVSFASDLLSPSLSVSIKQFAVLLIFYDFDIDNCVVDYVRAQKGQEGAVSPLRWRNVDVQLQLLQPTRRRVLSNGKSPNVNQ